MSEQNYQQDRKKMSIKTSLGDNILLLIKMEAVEKFSEPFYYRLELISTKSSIQIESLIDEAVSISIATGFGDSENYHGIVSEVGQNAFDHQGFRVYYAIVRPWLWWLSYGENCRIYQDKNLIDIVNDVFKKYPNVKFDTSKLNKANYQSIPYCVQYNETDMQFINRLLQANGVFYYFNHSESQHQLILADSKTAYQAAVGEPLTIHSNQPGFDQITSWRHQFVSQPGKVSYNSHDFTNPKAKLSASTNSLVPLKNNSNFECYRNAGNYQQVKAGTQATRLHMESAELRYSQVVGESNSRRLRVGRLITINQKAFSAEKNLNFVIDELSFIIEDHSYFTSEATEIPYQNLFHCVPQQQQYRPQQITPKPQVQGVQEAVITGPSSEEIYTDKYGRYKIYFYWDRINQPNEKSSCWVRASQHWQGLLRVGTPVIISYLNGDIDQPIILGPVDDADQMPLFTLPDDKTKSGIKRRPGRNGNDQQYNYIAFEDKKKNELLEIYAGKNLTETIENQRDVLLKQGSDTLTINKGDLTVKLLEGQYVLNAKKNIMITANGNMSLQADGNLTLKAGKAVEIKSGTNINIAAGTNLQQTASTNVDIKSSAQLSVKSAMTNIGADGILNLKGAMIKEN